jgi:HEAT repeat protein
MKRFSGKLIVAFLVAIGLMVASANVANAQKPSASDQLLKQVLERLNKVESELARLKGEKAKPVGPPGQGKLFTLLDSVYLGTPGYSGSTSTYPRTLALRMIFVNLTQKPISAKPEAFVLSTAGKKFKYLELTANTRSRSLRLEGRSIILRSLKRMKELKVDPGQTASTWVIFENLPSGRRVPKMKLKMELAGKESELDLNAKANDLLGLNVERIGPRKSLGLLTIAGSINTVNAGGIVDALDNLTANKVTRIVIRWTSGAPGIDGYLRGWLEQSAAMAGTGNQNNNNSFLEMPGAIRELHLAGMPSSSSTSSSYYPRYANSTSVAQRVHKTALSAVGAALKSAYESLPRNELVAEIRDGHPLTRAAAIAGGGGRLPDEHFPLLLEYVNDDDPGIQQSALQALAHFGDQRAVDALLLHAHKNNATTGKVAVESLARSRFAAAHTALINLLKNEGPASKKAIVAILGDNPRPVWSETVYQFISDPDPQVSAAAMTAIVKIGHPKIVDVLQATLETGDAARKTQAFSILSARTDARSERLAMDYTLKSLSKAPPTSQMLSLLNRTKDPKAIPILLKFLDDPKAKSMRSSIISTLSQIGDQSVAAEFVRRYPSLSTSEKSNVLNALRQLRSPEFMKLATQALNSRSSSLVSIACQGLQAEASNEAVKLLVGALKSSSSSSTWSYTSNALGVIATDAARKALIVARSSENSSKQSYARNALSNLWQRSPGMQYTYQARSYAQQKQWAKAEKQYAVAINADAQLPIAYSGRANTFLKQMKIKEARADFTKAVELDPWDRLAITGLGITMAIEGEYEKGIKLSEAGRAKYPTDNIFAYNLACVYGRALEYVTKDTKTADRPKKMAKYQQKALAELKRAVTRGFRDLTLMKDDPDLKTLASLPEFKAIHTPAAKKPAAKKAAGAPKAVPGDAAEDAPTDDADAGEAEAVEADTAVQVELQSIPE